MRTNFYLLDYRTNKRRKITKKVAMTLISANQLIEAKETFMRDPYIANDYMTREGMLRIEFEM